MAAEGKLGETLKLLRKGELFNGIIRFGRFKEALQKLP